MSPHVVPFGAPIPNPGWPEPGLPRRHTSASAFARRPAEDNDNVLFRGLGFVNCVLRKAATTQCLRCGHVSESSYARNDTNNYEGPADSIFVIIYVRTLQNPGWFKVAIAHFSGRK